MDARAGLALLAVAACGGAAPGPCAPRVLARGTLAYDAVHAGDAVYALELETRFALVVHDAATGAVRASIDLGGSTPDLVALAVTPDRAIAFVGGRDRAVRSIDLARGAVAATWPVGADVTALAADTSHVAIGDATGVVCLRTRAGALLQCVADADDAITALAIDGSTLEVRAGSLVRRYALPSLAATDRVRVSWAPDGPLPFRPGGPIRSVRATPHDTVYAAWVHDLDDPSVVLVPRGCAR
jgi:hypothetical protein